MFLSSYVCMYVCIGNVCMYVCRRVRHYNVPPPIVNFPWELIDRLQTQPRHLILALAASRVRSALPLHSWSRLVFMLNTSPSLCCLLKKKKNTLLLHRRYVMKFEPQVITILDITIIKVSCTSWHARIDRQWAVEVKGEAPPVTLYQERRPP